MPQQYTGSDASELHWNWSINSLLVAGVTMKHSGHVIEAPVLLDCSLQLQDWAEDLGM